MRSTSDRSRRSPVHLTRSPFTLTNRLRTVFAGLAASGWHTGKPLPITETGYRSMFLPAHTIDEEGGPVAFVTTWRDYAAELEG